MKAEVSSFHYPSYHFSLFLLRKGRACVWVSGLAWEEFGDIFCFYVLVYTLLFRAGLVMNGFRV